MGNKISSKSDANSDQQQLDGVYKHRRNHYKDYKELNNSLRSIWSFDSQPSKNSISRPCKRRWKNSTLSLTYDQSKTAWPVSQLQSYFLPEFPIKDHHKDKNLETLQLISKGAFGKVYKIVNLEKNEIFALKVLSKSQIVNDNSVKQVKEEVQIQKACGHHQFIVKCLLNWQSKRHLYIVTEYIEGGELWHLLQTLGVLPIEIVQLYVAQIALAIDFLHNAGIVYRDLKPENVLLDADANVKLIDFGLSKWLPYAATTETVCGTPKYMGMPTYSNLPSFV